jgi:hypothetical protein
MSTNKSSLVGERWQKLKILNADFELSGSGDVLAFRELDEEQVGDEQAGTRMDDEGCPQRRQRPDPHQRKDMTAFTAK